MTAKTGIFCCRPLRANSPSGSVWSYHMIRSRVLFETTTWPGLGDAALQP